MGKGARVGQGFENEIRASIKALKAIGGFNGLKLPIGNFERHMKSPPYDFNLYYKGSATAIECKAMSEPGSFAFNRLPLHQEQGLLDMSATGNKAYVVFGVMQPRNKQVWAMDINIYMTLKKRSDRKSLTMEEISEHSRYIERIPKIGWDLRTLFESQARCVSYVKEPTLELRSSRASKTAS